MAAVAVQVFVPVATNEGEPREGVATEVAAMLSEVAGGATIHAPSEGLWTDERTGKVYKEPVRIVEAHTAGDAAQLIAVAREAARYVKRELNQIVVLVRSYGLDVELV